MNLKAVMNEQGLTAADLADTLGVSQRRVEGWMYGEREPPIRYLVAMADALGCTVDTLVRPRKEGDTVV